MSVNATEINCNSELQQERKAEQARNRFVWNEFELTQTLKVAGAFDSEVYFSRMYALAAIAKHKGYKLSSPENAFKLEKLLLNQDPEHVCSSEHCIQLNMKRGQPYRDPATGHVHHASGAVYFCRDYGNIHLCVAGKACDRMAILPEDPTGGYVCLVTCQYKGTAISSRPKYELDQRVGQKDLDAIERADEAAGHDPGGIYVDPTNEETELRDKFYADKKWREENFNPATNLQVLQQYKLKNQGLGMLYNATGAQSVEELAHHLATQQAEAEQYLRSESKRYREGNAPRVRAKRYTPTVPRSELTPDQRSEQYLKRLEGKEEVLQLIIDFVTGSNAKRFLIGEARAEAREIGNKKVNSVLKRNSKKRFSALECYTIWLRAAQPKLRPRPQQWRLPVADVSMYVQAMQRLWHIVSYSPHARDRSIRKKHPLNFTKVAFGMLYTIGFTGLICDCTLPQDILEISEVQRETQLFRIVRRFPVVMMPLRKALGEILLPEADVQLLCNWKGSGVKYDKQVVFQGKSLLIECYNSIVSELKRKLAEELTADPTKAAVLLQQYVDSCLGSKLVL